jgi:hypothetical protein
MNIEVSRRSFLLFVGGAASSAVWGSVGVPKAYAAGVKISFAADSDVGEGGRWMKAVLKNGPKRREISSSASAGSTLPRKPCPCLINTGRHKVLMSMRT